MLALKIDPSRMNRSLAEAMRPQSAQARRLAAIRAALGPAMRSVTLKMPTDTNRLVNSYVIGSHAVGLAEFVGPIRPLQRSKYVDKQEAAVERQVDGFKSRVVYWRKQVALLERAVAKHGSAATIYLNGQRQDSFGNRLADARKRLAKAQKNVERAQREAEKWGRAEHAIVIGTFAPRRGRAIGTQVIEKVYGGTGRIVHTAESTMVTITSLEPHAAIVEARDHIVRDAKAGLRAVGVRTVGRKVAGELTAS